MDLVDKVCHILYLDLEGLQYCDHLKISSILFWATNIDSMNYQEAFLVIVRRERTAIMTLSYQNGKVANIFQRGDKTKLQL